MEEKNNIPLDIQNLVDQSFMLDTDIKKLNKEFDANKRILKEWASENGYTELSGVMGKAKIISSETTVIDPNDLWKLLRANARGREFWGYISVKIGDTTKAFGEMFLKSIIKKKPGTTAIKFSSK